MLHTLTNFKVGMTPNIYGEGIYRMEHFDTITGQARPYRALVASDLTHGAVSLKDLVKFARDTNDIYCLGKETGGTRGALGKWDTSNYRWGGFQSFNADGTFAEVLFYRDAYLYGLWKGTHLWRIPKAGGADLTGAGGTYGAITYTNYCQPILHSKDGLHYLGTDNVVSSFDGTTLATVLTLPAGFVITSLSENGDYLSILGYYSVSGNGVEFLWDRDSSLATVTQKYEIHQESTYHNATLGGTHFIITTSKLPINVSSSNNSLIRYLNIRYISGDKAKLFSTYRFSSLVLREGAYFAGESLFFHATVKFIGETTAHFVVFKLDEEGRLTIVQNLAINDAGSVSDGLPGISDNGDGFFIAGRTDGAWHTTTTYATTSAQSSFFETVKYSSPDFAKSIDVVGYAVTFESLPANASVVVKTRADAETAWTTVATFDTDNAVSGEMNSLGTSTCAERQFRVESLDAVITGFQVKFSEVPNSVYS